MGSNRLASARALVTAAFAAVASLPALDVGAQGASIPATASYSCDFENTYCDFNEQSKVAPAGRRSSIVAAAASGTRGVKLTTLVGDINVNGSGTWERNDLSKPPDASYCNPGQEEWWAFSVMFPDDYVFPPGPAGGIVMDFHHSGSSGQANYEIQTMPGIGLRARGYGGAAVNGGKYDALIPDPYGASEDVARNAWYHFVLHVRWSPNGDGLMEGWLNGRKYQSYQGATLYSGMSCYLKLANYHGPFGQASSVIHDRVARGATAAAVTHLALEGVSGTVPATELVAHIYRSVLRREPDAGGKAFWEGEVARMASLGGDRNESIVAMAASFFSSAEYAALNRDATGYVRDLYATFFDRAADANGLAFWTGQIGAGLPRDIVMLAFMFSPEFDAFTRSFLGSPSTRAEVDMVTDLYRGLLGRLPDSTGFSYWVQQFRTAQCQGATAVYGQVQAMSSAFLNSPEYARRARDNTQYVSDGYNAFLRRAGDLTGVRYWVGQLESGAKGREKVRQEFVASAEFTARVNAVVAQGCM